MKTALSISGILWIIYFPLFNFVGEGAIHNWESALWQSGLCATVSVFLCWALLARDEHKKPSRYRTSIYADNYRKAQDRGDQAEMNFWMNQMLPVKEKR